MRFDKEFRKFVITKYGAELLSPSTLKMHVSPKTLVVPVDRDNAMIDARPEVDTPLIGSKVSDGQFNQHSANERSLPKTVEISPSGKDVLMTGTRSEEVEPKTHSGKPAATECFSWLNNDSIRPKDTSPPKIYHHSFIADSSKFEAMIDFDNSETKEPFE